MNSMPIRKWILQYTLLLPIVLSLLAGVQYLKGRELEYCLEFALIWSLISVGIFAANRAYNFRRNIDCAICNDLPEANDDDPN
jgi:hypothetical protein